MRKVISCFVLVAALGAAPSIAAAQAKELSFAGLRWNLRVSTEPSPPGPCVFGNADDQAWVDETGRLHLFVRRRGETWSCTELLAKSDAGYGSYSFDVDGSALGLDPNLVFGFFTWDRFPSPYNRELDIELSRWGEAGKEIAWFTVQPYDRPGNQDSFDLPPAGVYSFTMVWKPGSATFACSADGALVRTWTYEGAVPEPGRARLRMNFWCFQGKAPSGEGPYEMLVSNLVYAPLD